MSRGGVVWWRVTVVAFSVAGVLAGLVVRAWLLVHQPLTGDEAIVALMAQQIRHGHFYSFYWGQTYGGAEPYLVAVLISIFGTTSVVAVNVTATILTAISTLLVWSIVRRLSPPQAKWVAYPAAAMFWVWPEAYLWNSTRELGFRCVTMLAGLAALRLALRWADTGSWMTAGGLGLAVGVGWWSSPEIVYFAIPILAVVVAGLARPHDSEMPPKKSGLLAVALGGALGAAPWIATNIGSGFESLSPSSSPVYAPSTYLGRLEIVFGRTVPMMLGLRRAPGGEWLAGWFIQLLYGLAAGALVAVCVWSLIQWRRSLLIAAIAATCLVVPFVNAVFPATTYWTEGLYGVYLVPLVVIVTFTNLAFILTRDRGRAPRDSVMMLPSVLVGLGVISTLICFKQAWLQTPTSTYSSQVAPSFVAGWTASPGALAGSIVGRVEAAGLHYGYADYWTAYVLDALGQGHLVVSDVHNDRWAAGYRQVEQANRQAWLFVHPGSKQAAQHVFPRTRIGPDGYSEAKFTNTLTQLGTRFSVIRLGVLDAVVPARPVTPSQVGMPPPEHS